MATRSRVATSPDVVTMTPDQLGDLLVRRLVGLPAEVFIGPDINTPELEADGYVAAYVRVRLHREDLPTEPGEVSEKDQRSNGEQR